MFLGCPFATCIQMFLQMLLGVTFTFSRWLYKTKMGYVLRYYIFWGIMESYVNNISSEGSGIVIRELAKFSKPIIEL